MRKAALPRPDIDAMFTRRFVTDSAGVIGTVSHARAEFRGSLQVRSKVRGPAHSVAKRVFDIVAASAGLLALLPGLLFIALAIKLTSRGPVLFRQRRYGLNNNRFVIYKFRTMYVDKSDESGVIQTCEGDERVTPLGRILRRADLDELPQLFNVVRGDMSLVGPRPHVPGMLAGGIPYEDLVPYYFERHLAARPGLTGLAQARGLRGSTRNDDVARARVDLDLRYIQTWSLALDIRLIVETIWSEIRGAGTGI